MDGGIGTRYEVDADGRFTGELDGPFMYGEGKVEAMRRFAAEHEIDLAASYAYSDSAPTCRCCGRSATRSWSTPTRPAAIAKRGGLAGDALREAAAGWSHAATFFATAAAAGAARPRRFASALAGAFFARR